MQIGIGAPVSGAWATPENLARFGVEAEELGYESLWTFQRLLVGENQQLAPVYQSVLDPTVALAFVAARTSRVRLGVAVINLPFISPAYMAKQAATLDRLSGGGSTSVSGWGGRPRSSPPPVRPRSGAGPGPWSTSRFSAPCGTTR